MFPRVCLGSLWLIRFPPTVQRTAVIGVKLAAHKCPSNADLDKGKIWMANFNMQTLFFVCLFVFS